MKKKLEKLVKMIVTHPQDVVVKEEQNQDFLTLLLAVHPDDLKLVIGKGGQTIKALRELLKIKAIQEKTKINLKLVEES